MFIVITTKAGNYYNTTAIELTNSRKDIRFYTLDRELVIVDAGQVNEIKLVR